MSMHDESTFSMHSLGSEEVPALVRVDVQGQLDAALLVWTLRQTYRNTGPNPLEVVYTFPLPHGAVLLGMAAEFGDRRLQGQVCPVQQAEEVYEEALAQGDAPVLLQRTGAGLHTANLGNLLPGEQVTLELRFAQLVAFDQGSLRLAIPTTIAPRYGQPQAAGLQPQQVPVSSLLVSYPLAISLTVRGALARGEVVCPTHPHRLERLGADLRLTLADGATMDRDVVVRITPAEPVPGLLLQANDAASRGAPRVALAAFDLPREVVHQRVALRLLVDCSGSMAGDKIQSARAALRGLADRLNAEDEVSVSRFGQTVQHALDAAPATGEHLLRLQRAIDETDATMGGTEMQAALQAVFSALSRQGTGADVLMITDGEVWSADALVTAARRSGHRVFVIGVGTAPVEGVLRQLADATGGAAEFATPGESMILAVKRMLARIRQAPMQALRVDWGAAPVWQWPIPPQAFGGEGLLLAAGFAAQASPSGPARLMATDVTGAEHQVATTAALAPSEGQDLARILAARRLADLVEARPDEARQLAIDYQLLSASTNYLLVNVRAADQRPLVQPRLATVAHTLPAGWGGTGSELMGMPTSRFFAPQRRIEYSEMFEIKCVSTMPEHPYADLLDPAPLDMGLDAVALAMVDLLQAGRPVDDLFDASWVWRVGRHVRYAVNVVSSRPDLELARTWLLLALWVVQTHRVSLDQPALDLLTKHAAVIDQAAQQAAFAVFQQRLGEPDPAGEISDDISGRQARLNKAMAQQGGG